MAIDETGTYQDAKRIFEGLEPNIKRYLEYSEREARIFRKHLLEMAKRKASTNKYVTRLQNNRLMIMRIE
jgi:hypothetical protein